MKRWKRWATLVAVPVLGIIGIGLPTSVAGAATGAPTVKNFAPSPSTLTGEGGTVNLSAVMTLGGSCTLTTTPSLAHFPITTSCSATGVTSGVIPIGSATIPPNGTKKPMKYKFTLTVLGLLDPTLKTTKSVTVTEAVLTGSTYVAIGDSGLLRLWFPSDL